MPIRSHLGTAGENILHVAAALAIFWLKIDSPYVIFGAMVIGLLLFRQPSL